MYQNRPNLKSWAEEDRPREKFIAKGKASLSNAELIAILIGSGNRDETALDLAKRILLTANNRLDLLAKMDLAALKKHRGVGTVKALSIAAAMELGRRRLSEQNTEAKLINSSQAAFECLHAVFADLPHEEFWVILLNRANRVIRTVNISKGGLSGTVADAKLIFKSALENNALGIILCHNHPSGNLKASAADLSLTKKMVEAGKNLDIPVLDHLIFGNNAYYSFADDALI